MASDAGVVAGVEGGRGWGGWGLSLVMRRELDLLGEGLDLGDKGGA